MNKENTDSKEFSCCVNPNKKVLDLSYWDMQWQNQKTGWDIGYASPAIKAYMEQYQDKNAAILIPGCGNAYEAEFLLDSGFTNITLLDIAPSAVEKMKEKFAHAPQIQILCGDFFQHEGQYDLIIEQTFFCALDPVKRSSYVDKMHSLLSENGKIIGLLFDTVFEADGPPFGGKAEEYRTLFEEKFKIRNLDTCYNSIAPRNGKEVFINFSKK